MCNLNWAVRLTHLALPPRSNRAPCSRISARVILVGRARMSIPSHPADLTDREAATELGATIARTHIIDSGQFPSSPGPPAETVPAHRRPSGAGAARLPGRSGANAMRSLLALGLLIALCASADAANSAFALSTRLALATTVRHKPNVGANDLDRSTPPARSRFLHRNYGNPDGPTSLSEDGYTMWNGRSASEWGGG